MAGVPGLEPRLTESESAVLPLDDTPKTPLIIRVFMKCSTIFLPFLEIILHRRAQQINAHSVFSV